jgi:hypothetical protein
LGTIAVLNKLENVSIFRSGHEHNGRVLGSEGELFWLFVADVNEVHRGHTDRLFVRSGTKYLYASEWHNKVETLFDSNGHFTSDIFEASSNQEEMIGFIKTYRLIESR